MVKDFTVNQPLKNSGFVQDPFDCSDFEHNVFQFVK